MADLDRVKAYEEVETRLGALASPQIRPGLERAEVLYRAIGSPQDFPVIHVAGTNGKGSTSAYLASMLAQGGYRTALYTSPHLLHAGERLLIDGQVLPPERWLQAVEVLESVIARTPTLKDQRPSYFEVFTAAAFWLIAQEQVQIAVVETGMGGRLDATNLLNHRELSVITPIALDHMAYLGATVERIAAEKFGIVQTGGRALFVGGGPELNEQFHSICVDREALGSVLEEDCQVQILETSLEGNLFRLTTPEGTGLWRERLLGTHQPLNAALALRAMELLGPSFPCSAEDRRRGLEKAHWPGRLELISSNPMVFLDGAHNPHGMEALAQSLKALFGPRRPLTVVYATMSDKKYMEGLAALRRTLGRIRLICTEVPGSLRSEKALTLASKASALRWPWPPRAMADPFAAIEEAILQGDPLLCCGSLYFIGHVRQSLVERYHARRCGRDR